MTPSSNTWVKRYFPVCPSGLKMHFSSWFWGQNNLRSSVHLDEGLDGLWGKASPKGVELLPLPQQKEESIVSTSLFSLYWGAVGFEWLLVPLLLCDGGSGTPPVVCPRCQVMKKWWRFITTEVRVPQWWSLRQEGRGGFRKGFDSKLSNGPIVWSYCLLQFPHRSCTMWHCNNWSTGGHFPNDNFCLIRVC